MFDKDGTLFDFNATWMPLYLDTANEVAGGDKALALKLLVESGFDAATQRLDPHSPLAAGTNAEIAEISTTVRRLHDSTEPPASLTKAQKEALRCVAEGDRHAAAAAKLGIREDEAFHTEQGS